jgi:hypothetical protein
MRSAPSTGAVGDLLEGIGRVAFLQETDGRRGGSPLCRMSWLELARKLGELPDDLVRAWDRGGVAAGSKLEVLDHDELVSVGLLTCDSCAVIEVGPASRQSATENTTMAERLAVVIGRGPWSITTACGNVTPIG